MSIEIKRNSLAWRWYQYWTELGGTPRNPENLCRFIRVLLIYAPLRWFGAEKRNGVTRSSPLKWIIVVSMATMLVAVVGYQVWQEPLFAAKAVGGTVAILAAIGLLIWGTERITGALRESQALAKHYREAQASKLCPYIEVKD